MTGVEAALVLLVWSAPASTSATAPAERVRVVCSMPPAKRTKFVRPTYPKAAVEAGLSGQVVIDMAIARAGKTADLRVAKGVAPELDQAALDAVKQWEYAPLLVNGQPREFVLTVRVDFRLPGATTQAVGGRSPK